MVKEKVVVLNEHGIHTRPATAFVTLAGQFDSEIFITYQGKRVNAKSILGLLVLAIEPGAEIEIETDGSDEKEALEELIELVNNKFGTE